MITACDIKAKYWTLEILSSSNQDDISEITTTLENSKIDINPHQIEAALFFLNSPISKGIILADEVGLGKTIEAGIIISEMFSKGLNSILVVAPASICQQWKVEIEEKFNIPSQIIDTKIYRDNLKKDKDILLFKGVTICSYNCAVHLENIMKLYKWDLVIIDEAHKLRNLYKGNTKISDSINKTFENSKKLLLTATPIQNSLMDIFSLVSIIDPYILGNEYSFMENYLYSNAKHLELKKRLQTVLHRTLRKDVLEYIKYTNREAITIGFNPKTEEEVLYTKVSQYIKKISHIAITTRFRSLILLMIQKLMSSSTAAIKGTLEGLIEKLEHYEQTQNNSYELSQFIKDDNLQSDYKDSIEDEYNKQTIVKQFSKEEILAEKQNLQELIDLADKIKVDGKTEHLIEAIEQGFEKIKEKGGQRKVIIFTESNRTLNYLFDYLSNHGFKDKIITFNGENNSDLCNKIYTDYIKNHKSMTTGSKSNDMKRALVDKFKEDAEIMIATEAASEGLNLQFCSLLINYDLPWNPQRIEQRIGRIHRYGQKCDVVIINFINKKNIADIRLYDILQQKFNLFNGVFGASDEILGTLSDGIDFERAVASIFELCRTTDEINRAFDELQAKLSTKRETKINETTQLILENLTPTTQEKFHLRTKQINNFLKRRKEIFWDLTVIVLKRNHPEIFINDQTHTFGQFKEQVFNIPSNINFKYNFNFTLDLSEKQQIQDFESKKLSNYKPTIYNPETKYGNIILNEALDIDNSNLHIILNPTNKLNIGQKGRLKLSLCEIKSPKSIKHIISTIITDSGEILNIDASNIFDNIKEIKTIQDFGYKDYIDQIHEQDIKKYETSQKQKVDNLLKTEIEKLNCWLIDEKNAIHIKVEKMKNKITNLKRQFKMEKDFETKLNINTQIKQMQEEMNNKEFNTFETEKEFEKKRNQLIGAKKRSLKMKYNTNLIFDITWSVE